MSDAMTCMVDDLVDYEGQLHAVTSIRFSGFVPPYFGLRCLHEPPCGAARRPVSHWHVQPVFRRLAPAPTLGLALELRPTATELVDGGHEHVTPDGTVWRHTDPDCTAPVGAKEDRP